MESVRALVAPGRRSDEPACRAPDERGLDYRRFCTGTWKSAHFLRHLGGHDGALVGVAGEGVPSLLSTLGAGVLGATVDLDPDPAFDGRVIVGPVATVRAAPLPPGGQRVATDASPDDPDVHGWAAGTWSENPTQPPEATDPSDPLVARSDGSLSQRDVVATAADVAADRGIGPDQTLVHRDGIEDAEGLVAVLAPLAAGASVVLAPGRGSVSDADGPTPAVADGDVPW